MGRVWGIGGGRRGWWALSVMGRMFEWNQRGSDDLIHGRIAFCYDNGDEQIHGTVFLDEVTCRDSIAINDFRVRSCFGLVQK